MMEKEALMEQKLIDQLTHGKSQWTLREDLKTEDQLWNNFFKILERNNQSQLNDVPLTEHEKEIIKSKMTHSTFYNAAKDFIGANNQYHIAFQRDDTKIGTIDLLVVDNSNVAGGGSTYEVVHQIELEKRSILDNNRRYDVSLMINGLPLIHIELKTPNHSIKQAFNQIQKYIKERKFTGIFSNVQMFVVTNGTETQYIAAAQQLREKFLSGWVDKDNKPVHDYLDFAKDVLSIPMAHHMVSDYSVLDSKQKHIILLRPYQIHAIEAILKASSGGDAKSGYIWHTTGSGKTLTSYRVAHNLLKIPSIDKVVFLIDRKDLDNQTSQAFQSYANNDSIDIDETESTVSLAHKLSSNERTVLVTTRQKLQTLLKWMNNDTGNERHKTLKSLRVAFIVDECHRTVSSSSKLDIDRFFAQKPLWYGFTGTPIFMQNMKAENGKAARTTEEQYGPCLHSYTIKDAIRDNAVLGFKVNDLRNIYQDDDDENDKEKLNHQYISSIHMREVAKNILQLSYRTLGIRNINNRGYTYSAMLTTKPSGIRPIEQAKRYYNLFCDIKNENSEVKIPRRIKEILPDFPKVAVTFSITENGDDSSGDQDFMKKAIDNYNKMYGTSYSLAELDAYNKNISDRLARKSEQYKPQSERLDLVIVVDRMLTGFDSQYLSTLFVDRPPMAPQDIIQSFSRTNRIFDQDKKYGNIVTFQFPRTFSKAIDNALTIYSKGGIGEVKAPDWKTSKFKFDSAYHTVVKYMADEGKVILDAPEDKQKEFIKDYQRFDKAYSAIQTYDEFDDIDPERDYSLSSKVSENLCGSYKVLVDKFKKDNQDDEPQDEVIDTDYQLESYISKSVNYQYILSLIQNYLPNEGELLSKASQSETDDIDKYIDELGRTNKPLSKLVSKLWEKVKAHPENFAGQQMDQLLNEMIEDYYNQELVHFSEQFGVPLESLKFTIKHFDASVEKQPGVNQMLSRDAFNRFKENNDEFNNMMEWRRNVKKQFNDLYLNKISPLINE